MYKIGMVGLGAISKYFLAAIESSESFDLVAVCDINPANFDVFLNGRIKCFANYKLLSDSCVLDAVVVATPNFTHFEIVNYFLDKGIHVLCEKPLTLATESFSSLIVKAVNNGLVLQTAFHRRFNKHFVEYMKLKGSEIPRRVIVRYKENIELHSSGEEWYKDVSRSGGGCVIDNGINCLDILHAVVGEYKIEGIHVGKKHGLHDQLYDDSAVIEIVYDGGKGMIELDWSYDGEQKSVTCYHDHICYEIDFLKDYEKFKASLWHEYVGIIGNFAEKITNREIAPDKSSLLSLESVKKIYTENNLI